MLFCGLESKEVILGYDEHPSLLVTPLLLPWKVMASHDVQGAPFEQGAVCK